MVGRQFEQVARPFAVDPQRCNGVALVGRWTGGAGKVVDPVEARQSPQRLHNVVVKVREAWMLTQIRYVLAAPRNEVVDADDFVATSQQPFTQVGPDEPGTSGY
jgi:hypothetical protein